MSDLFNSSSGSGKAQQSSGQTISTFLGSVGGAFAVFGIQFMLFYVLKNRFTRIYRPKTYLVPEKDRTKAPPDGLFKWIIPVFTTPNAVLISKCGLDAYFFLRFLRMLLKIFIPSAILILPILLPINISYKDNADIKGMDKLGWQNFNPAHTDRFWAHLIMAVIMLFWTCYVIYDELRGYIRVRQAYLTSPQHRLRASATTVLVTSIPRKWLTYEALDGLYDVFPGGIRNIWINRNFDELNDKVQLRDKLAKMLEGAETALIREAKKNQMKIQKKEEKKQGHKKSKAQEKKANDESDAAALAMAEQPGLSSGDPHQIHTIDEALGQVSDTETEDESPADRPRMPIQALGRGVDTLTRGLGAMGTGITGFGKKIVGDVTNAPKYFDQRINSAYQGAGFAYDGSEESVPFGKVGTVESQQGRSDTLESQRRKQHASEQAHNPTFGQPPSASRDPHEVPVTQVDVSTNLGYSQNRPIRAEGRIDRANTEDVTDVPNTPAGRQPHISEDSNRTAVEKNPYKVRPEKNNGKLDWTNNGFLQPAPSRGWKIWQDGHGIVMPSPEPKEKEDAELKAATDLAPHDVGSDKEKPAISPMQKILGLFSRKGDDEPSIKEEYAAAFNEEYVDDAGLEMEPAWKNYLTEKDRDTCRLPLFGKSWMPHMPSWTFLGKKVDTIYYCRKELARLNLEIEEDQREPEKFPLMNSAFIQFNHQVAAHMACQSVSHHVPNQMAPRIVEIAPGDIIWDNLSIKWWERFIRIGVVIVVVTGLVIAWAIPVSFTGAISNLDNLQKTWPGVFGWLANIPTAWKSALQGVLPAVFLGILFALLPVILRFAAKQQGVPTGMSVELSVQGYYFAFSFVQLFLVVTISKGLFEVLDEISKNPTKVPEILATNIPKTGNFFFSYLLLQALSVSAGSLAQISELVKWFILRPLTDNTARQKFSRQLKLPTVQWGTFFPVYTNLACIGLIFSVISPLVMVFNIITFSLFWVAYRYQTLYVSTFKFDTGGLLFPKAVNQLFTGIYVMEVALIGLFFLVRSDAKDSGAVCFPQAIIMIVCLIFTVLYQFLVNWTFSPLYRYMPITLEDDAVRRDEEFERAQSKRWEDAEEAEGDDIEERLAQREHQEEKEEMDAEAIELEDIRKRRSSHLVPTTSAMSRMGNMLKPKTAGTWADRARTRHTVSAVDRRDHGSPSPSAHPIFHHRKHRSSRLSILSTSPLAPAGQDLESGGKPGASRINHHTADVGDALFGGISDEIEDLTAEERDILVQRAFQHEALRSRRPVIWIPRDDLGVSDDEIRRTQAFTDNIWISNEFTGLDRKARVVFRRAPPDFSEVDLIEL